MKKAVDKILCIILTLVLLACAFPLSASASQNEDIARTKLGTSNTYYSFDATSKTLTISGSGATPNLKNNNTSQPWYNWKNDGSIERIVIEEGITSLGQYLFYCVFAEEVQLPGTLTSIGSRCFEGNETLTDITLPDSLISIQNNAFAYCSSLESITIPSAVRTVGDNAFSYCTALENVTFENMRASITIRTNAFLNCTSLKSVDIPYKATLMSNCFGYQNISSNTLSLVENFCINVYRDSAGYNYAYNRAMRYELLDTMCVNEAEEINREYFDDSVGDEMIFEFTPVNTAEYTFSSSGTLDVDCVLTNASGAVIAECEDNSSVDLNFTITAVLTGGQSYYYIVTCNRNRITSDIDPNANGKYAVSLMPVGIDSVAIDWNLSYSVSDVLNGRMNIADDIAGLPVSFIYSSGYVCQSGFADGGEYLGYSMSYNDFDKENELVCGNNSLSVFVGDNELSFNVFIEHDYVTEVVEPTLTTGGYTIYTCYACGYSFHSDFVDKIGVDITGRVLVMKSPDGELGKPLKNIEIKDHCGDTITVTDENGCFSVENAYDYIIIDGDGAGPVRIINAVKENENLGDVGLVYCDYNADGYINAKDLALLKSIYGEYDKYDEYAYIFENMDINSDDVLSYEDWEYAENYLAYGKLTESIYDN